MKVIKASSAVIVSIIAFWLVALSILAICLFIALFRGSHEPTTQTWGQPVNQVDTCTTLDCQSADY